MERTFVMVKPDGVRRGLVGEVVRRLEGKGLRLVGMKLMQVDEALAARHYAEHRDKPFYPELIAFITSGPSVPMVVEGRDAVAVVRTLMGATDPAKAAPGTLRGDWALSLTENLVHGSDSPESAAREIALYFEPHELLPAGR
ncbi:nucleoside diphosphate kinase [Candidatus Hydrogenisulfobacillus filiaventi]|uniref:Nucleoside diphosphate kinase n=1 Tax=Candidatus Hydrogenisulfobacillus filiaventi TaxID=2707344 RepID=A0A6F8ZGL1_9FIRM|nr:nucleoside-diphosphate kinase [Bacillota bacterium]CAB1128732.1 nucleoside diphosphate kinase [Candidatus Hydrogenisulfobacillus filiaventi]